MTPARDGRMGELKPCPFCGEQPRSNWQSASLDEDCGYWAVEHCTAFAHGDSEAEAIAAWNTRAPNPLIEQLVEALDWTPTGALGLPKWQFDLRAASAVLETLDQPLSPEFRVKLSDMLGSYQPMFTTLSAARGETGK